MTFYTIEESTLKKEETAKENAQNIYLLSEEEVNFLEGKFPGFHKQVALHRKTTHTMVESHQDYYFLKVRKRKGNSANNQSHHYSLYLDKSALIILGETQQDCSAISPAFSDLKGDKLTLGSLLYRVLLYLIIDDFEMLQDLEKKITQLEEKVLNKHTDRFNYEMAPTRKELLYLHTYYERLVDLTDDLVENENKLLTKQEVGFFRRFLSRCERLSQSAQVLREFVLQVQEIYQAQVDLRQNNIMRVLTVVTTIFFPLSLITSWYGMNFRNMPELEWQYGYPIVIVVSVIIVILSVWWFKRKGYF